MALTTQQKQLIKAAIDADPALSSLPNNSDGAFAIAAILNLTATPDYVVWRTEVSGDEIMLNGFDWTQVDNLTVGKARIWDWMLRAGSLNPSKSNIRAGIDATWVGNANALAVREAIYVHCKRLATRAEKLLATGSGTGASPSTMTFEGMLGYQDVESARAS